MTDLILTEMMLDKDGINYYTLERKGGFTLYLAKGGEILFDTKGTLKKVKPY